MDNRCICSRCSKELANRHSLSRHMKMYCKGSTTSVDNIPRHRKKDTSKKSFAPNLQEFVNGIIDNGGSNTSSTSVNPNYVLQKPNVEEDMVENESPEDTDDDDIDIDVLLPPPLPKKSKKEFQKDTR